MAEEQIQGFAGLNMNQVKDAVGAVIGSGDDVAAAVSFVAEHGDDIIDLVGRLPELLATTSSALSDAADTIGTTADFLTGGKKSGTGVRSLTYAAGQALDSCRDELGSAKKLLDTVGKAFDDLPIPDGGIGDRLTDAAKRFDTVGDRLADAAEQLRQLGGALDKAGHGLADTASKLDAGGKALARFSN